MRGNEAFCTLLSIAAYSAFTQNCSTTWAGCVSVRDAMEVYLSDRCLVNRHLQEIEAARPIFSDRTTLREKREAEDAYNKAKARICDEMRERWVQCCKERSPSPTLSEREREVK